MSDFHPETWNPSWSVASILTGLLSFMLESTETTGSVNTTDDVKRAYAKQSRKWNRESNPKFKGIPTWSNVNILLEMFPDLYAESSSFPGESEKAEAGEPTKVSIKPKTPLDDDVIANELRYFVSSGGLYMLLGGIIVYLCWNYAFNK
jgi:hypothetical protein